MIQTITTFFTPEHAAYIAMLLPLLAAAFSFLVWLAPRTRFTDIDDKAVEAIMNGKKFIEPIAMTTWHYVEEAQKNGLLPAGVSKAVFFMEQIAEAYKKHHDSAIPEEVKNFAQSVANGMSAADKVVKKIESLAPVSPNAPKNGEKNAAAVANILKGAVQNPPSAPESR